MEDPAIATDAPRLVAAHAEVEAAQKELDALYARWVELEDKVARVAQQDFAGVKRSELAKTAIITH